MVKLDDFVTIQQAARFLGVSLNTLRNWHHDGKMTVYRKGPGLVTLRSQFDFAVGHNRAFSLSSAGTTYQGA